VVAQPHCRPTNPDRSLLEVGCRLQDGTLTSLRISLPPGFPGDRPALSITSPVRHPWVDAVGRLNFPLLERWGAPNVRLAAVVADAFKGLGGTPAPAPSQPASPARPQQAVQHPPPSAQSSGVSMGSLGSGPASMSPAPSGSSAAAGPQRTRVVPIPASFAEVAGMGEEQLARTLADERAYQQLVEQLAASLNLWQVVDKLKGETRELAAANLAKSEEQGEIRNQMAIIRSGEYAPAKAAFDDNWARQQAVLSKMSPEVLIRRFVKAQATYHQRDLRLQAAQQTLPNLTPR
jgi:ESCRT-I complex subunit VPS37